MVKKVRHLSEHRACGINQPHLFKVIYKNSIKFLINVEYSIAAIQPPTWCAMWLVLSAKIFRSTLVTPFLKLSKKHIQKNIFHCVIPQFQKKLIFLVRPFSTALNSLQPLTAYNFRVPAIKTKKAWCTQWQCTWSIMTWPFQSWTWRIIASSAFSWIASALWKN